MEFSLPADFFQSAVIPVDDYIREGLRWLVENYRQTFRDLKKPIAAMLKLFERTLRESPPTLIILIMSVLAWQLAGKRVAWITLSGLVVIGLIGAWQATMTSFAILITAVLLCMIIGIPVGILASRSNLFATLLRPVLDLMQTIPSFVYLVPIIVTFGIGNVPGVIVTAIYAVPPLIRMTNLGLREVRADLIEAAEAFGSSPLQLLLKIRLPLARPSIMAGLNQTIMLSLAMSVVASMISVAGLGRIVLIAIQQLDLARAAVGGLGIVILAVIVDRITQSFGHTRRDRSGRSLIDGGPIGLIRAAIRSRKKIAPPMRPGGQER